MFARRTILSAPLVAGAAGALGPAVSSGVASPEGDPIAAKLEALEVGQARLGVAIHDTATGAMVGHRLNEHFAMCSTFKLALAAACYAKSEAGQIDLQKRITFTADDLVVYSPVTRDYVGEKGMTLLELMEATVTTSDNTAAKLLIDALGGPAGVTAMFRSMGDDVTCLDRNEPMMNLVLSADLRDTTTPAAMAGLVARFTAGPLLSEAARKQLVQWMVDTRTGLNRIRAGLPNDWVSGDKTGTGRGPGITNKYNDIAITYPPGRAPVVICVYYDSARQSAEFEADQQAVLAEAGRLAADWIERRGR